MVVKFPILKQENNRKNVLRVLRTVVIAALSVIVCFLLQGSVFSALSFSGITPNLLLVVTASFGLLLGDVRGMAVGVCCGLLGDIFFGPLLGFQTLLYALIGFGCGKFERSFFVDELRLPILLIVACDFLYGFVSYVFLFLVRGRFFFSYFLWHRILPEMVYTLLAAAALYPLLLFLYNRFMKKRREDEANGV